MGVAALRQRKIGAGHNFSFVPPIFEFASGHMVKVNENRRTKRSSRPLPLIPSSHQKHGQLSATGVWRRVSYYPRRRLSGGAVVLALSPLPNKENSSNRK